MGDLEYWSIQQGRRALAVHGSTRIRATSPTLIPALLPLLLVLVTGGAALAYPEQTLGPAQSIYDTTTDSVGSRHPNPGHGLLLTAVTPATAHESSVERLNDRLPAGSVHGARRCLPPPPRLATPTPTGDFVGRVAYGLGILNPGQGKAVKLVYRAF